MNCTRARALTVYPHCNLSTRGRAWHRAGAQETFVNEWLWGEVLKEGGVHGCVWNHVDQRFCTIISKPLMLVSDLRGQDNFFPSYFLWHCLVPYTCSGRLWRGHQLTDIKENSGWLFDHESGEEEGAGGRRLTLKWVDFEWGPSFPSHLLHNLDRITGFLSLSLLICITGILTAVILVPGPLWGILSGKSSVNSEMSRDMSCGGLWPRQLGNSGDSRRVVVSALGLPKNTGSEAEPAGSRFPGLCLQKLLCRHLPFHSALRCGSSSLPPHPLPLRWLIQPVRIARWNVTW